MTAPRCRLLPFQIADGAWQMAADEVLLETAQTGQASLRFYGWSQPTVSLGYFQNAAPVSGIPTLADLPLVRRCTGGAALVHHFEITYALALPLGQPWQRPGESWIHRLHTIIASAFARLGAATHLVGPAEEKKLGELLCFLHQTPDDLLLDTHKIVGSAQRKQRGALLQHGGILLAQSPHTPELPGIRALSGLSLLPAELSSALQLEITRDLSWTLDLGSWSAAETQRLEELSRTRYGHPSWTYKR